ncbi:octaprenyl diphosphate synthase [Blochmannia endosymbiont of Polyrhachis (Hedomyrma) turneri]|uniref:octaprenyl diphosphate synthase n=1 Tax=Blochmannia endosymbiont of Polyrhachis (Hedomyrma) turneri TaxID=1505596 RepID=UPI00061A63FA|nr:octaprenyl diphosphate synthase [Blochmannia endosymbiont of Polyrhachis (Hedomyrma) turneri]AKC59678.1 octaprenyl-diphosphate synthase [Blochmannia endosymbiont of Polyrhachis (Hedomyrma) turneri]
MNFKKIANLTAQDMRSVNKIINNQLNSKIPLISKLTYHITNNGGKQLRPMIVILTAQALKYKKKQHITIAALMELIHIATLLHDDVIDKSNIRRGKKTANTIFGNSASVLVGDFIYTKVLKILVTIKFPRILQLISKTVHTIAEGEILQLTQRNNPNTTIKTYMEIIYKKTACLFEASAQSSAILINATRNQELALRNYGRYLGFAFQLIDDMLDYNTNNKKLKQNIGNDLNEGKATFPLLHSMQYGTKKQVSIIQKAIQQGNNKLLEIILNTMHQYNSLEYTRQYANMQAKKAITALECLTPSPHLNALKHLAYIIIHRDF